ncbi:MAG TPA: hypothetical protein VKP61_08860 [Candidatus Acidoferrum sp.]|nr:hypothetical protein [Candidatus Acidoferrum sp.]
MSILDSFGTALAGGINSQISAAEDTAVQAAKAVAVWAVIVVVELGLVIFLLSKRPRT